MKSVRRIDSIAVRPPRLALPVRAFGAGSVSSHTLGLGPLLSTLALAVTIHGVLASTARGLEPSASDSLKAIAQTDGTAAADKAASQAVTQLQGLPSAQISSILAGFEGASRRGKNWLRALAADVSDNGPFPERMLRSFYQDRSGDPDARYVAFQLLTQHDAKLKPQLLAKAETDPSLPVRYLKIESMIDRAQQLKSDQPQQAIEQLRAVVEHARSPQQLQTAADLLGELGQEVDLAAELGMFQRWWLIGPFDNTDSQHFDTAYTPENRYLENGSPIARNGQGEPQAEQGKGGRTVNWQTIETDDRLGMVDLNAPLSNEKDGAAYVFARFRVDQQPFDPAAQIRLGCITANKVWVNGKLVSSNEVYHSGTRIDQYVDPCQLVPGENTVLIKVLQNAQTEPWAQDWEFQFRLTRPDGSAIEATVLP